MASLNASEINEDFIKSLLLTFYGITPMKICPLKGHADISYYLEVESTPLELRSIASPADGDAEERQHHQKFTLKIKLESKESELRSQLLFMSYLRRKGFCIPECIRSLNGDLFVRYVKRKNGESRLLRVPVG